MSDMKKVYHGLKSVDRQSIYHLGHYEVDFQDGTLRFQLQAQICGDERCYCDNIKIDWHSEGRIIESWYTGEREWLDQFKEAMPDVQREVFGIVERLETFQERYSHLVYLRRKMVLEELKRDDEDFKIRIPLNLIGPGADSKMQTLGKVRPGSRNGKALPYAIDFCGETDCYCNNLFVTVYDKNKHTGFCVDNKNRWEPVESKPEHHRLMERVAKRLTKDELFGQQLNFLRLERTLHNYHRFVSKYKKEQLQTN